MAVQEAQPASLTLGSQLSDAVASFLYASFDDVAKNLISRLQAPEAKVATKAEVKDVEPTPVSPPPPEPEPEPEPAPLFNVPYARNPRFVGRSAYLSRLFEMWKPGHTNRIAVVGLGGIGKTELVLEFVHRIRDISPTTPVYWFTPVNLLDEWLEQNYNSDCLVVVDPGDNFQDLIATASGKERLIDKLLRFGGTTILLARSVQHGSMLAGPREICKLDDLELDASADLLSQRLGTEAQWSSSELQEVAQLMTCLPRAILQVAALINDTGMTVSQFLQLYGKGDAMRLRLFGRLDPVSRPDHNLSIIEKGIVDIKTFRDDFPTAARILYKAFYLGAMKVPRCILTSSDHLETLITMNILRGYHMMKEDNADSETLHPLVSLAIRARLNGERPQADEKDIEQERSWFEEAVLSFSESYPDLNSENRAWWRSCFAQLLGGYDLSTDALRLAVAKMHHKESAFLKCKGHYAEALKMVLLAKHLLPDPVPPELLSTIKDQIILLDVLGKYREVQTSLQQYPHDEQQSSSLWRKKMQARLEQLEGANRYDSAVDIFRQIKSTRETTNSSMQDLLQSVDDLGCVLMLKGRYQDAITEFRRALSERTKLLGISHIETLSSLHNIASMLSLDGKYEEALRYIQEATRGRESALGPDHPETLLSKLVKTRILISMAVTTSDYDQAEKLLMDASNGLSTFLTEAHPAVIVCRSDRAQIMLARGKYEAAEQLSRAALSAREAGPWMESSSHPETLASLHQLAEILRLKDGCRAANALSERVLAERTEVLTHGTLTGNDFHPDQLTSLHHRAIVLSGLGQHLPALQKIDSALTGRRTVLGSDHPDVFMTMTWKGEIMRSQLPTYQTQRAQTLDAIEGLHKQALEGLTWIFGPEHYNSLQCLTNLALAKQERGTAAHAEVEALHRQVYRAYQRNLGDLHPETLKSKSRLAEAMRALSSNNHQEAKKMWREACAGFAKVFGIDAYLTFSAYKGYEKFLKVYPEP